MKTKPYLQRKVQFLYAEQQCSIGTRTKENNVPEENKESLEQAPNDAGFDDIKTSGHPLQGN
jgi:hypothetical protein